MLPELTRASRLRPGDRVGVVAPAGPVPAERLDAGLTVMRGWGLDVEVAPHVLERHSEFEYLAGDDSKRAHDLQAAWCNPDLSAVFCARGGYGVQRMLDLIDWDAMRAATAAHGPKILAGYSDITALHEAFASQLGVATLHSPMPGTIAFADEPDAVEHLRATLFHPSSTLVITHENATTVVPGRASGVTIGGNLSLLASGIGSPTGQPSAAGGIVLLEDLEEEHYKLDRMLTQLLRAGWFDGVAGIALGSWVDCGPGIPEVMRDRLGGLGVPIVDELGFGHCTNPLTIPLGVEATLDADRCRLMLAEPALR